jgi:L-malate glycosyltransferase
MPRLTLHQFTEAAAVGDATTDHMLLIRQWLREMGFVSEIYAVHREAALEKEVRSVHSYRRRKDEPFLIYHHATGAQVVDKLCALGIPLILIYHNVTPPEYFAGSNPHFVQQLTQGRAQLDQLRPFTALALGVSHYNESELQARGFAPTAVLPIVLDPAHYDIPSNQALLAECQQKGPTLLFVGRIAPNKRHEDLLKLLYHYRRLNPAARLILVGSAHFQDYLEWLQQLAIDLNLAEAVTITGHVSHQDMVTYFRGADLFVSMSEHEGFGKPLIESMYLGLPVMAYASAAVPLTMGSAGILFHQKDYEALAEFVDILLRQTNLRQRLVARQKGRAHLFLKPTVQQQWQSLLAQLGLTAP